METKLLESKIHSFPKIFHVGDRWVRDIFEKEVEITEKIDGSQFSFGRIDGELVVRSKGVVMCVDTPNKMFGFIVSYVKGLELPDNVVFYGEYLNKPKHNTLEYDHIPKNYLALFGVCTKDNVFVSEHGIVKEWADRLGFDCVPLIFKGKIDKEEQLMALLDTMSFLGKSKIEGVVIKRYEPVMLGNIVVPLMAAKFVSEAFKEKHTGWAKEHTVGGKWDSYKESFRTEARWIKAIQHLKENGSLTESPKDIGPLIKEVMSDITTEEQDNIKTFLWKEFGEELLRKSIAGFAEYYKERLLKQSLSK